jgi:hypothetical protein
MLEHGNLMRTQLTTPWTPYSSRPANTQFSIAIWPTIQDRSNCNKYSRHWFFFIINFLPHWIGLPWDSSVLSSALKLIPNRRRMTTIFTANSKQPTNQRHTLYTNGCESSNLYNGSENSRPEKWAQDSWATNCLNSCLQPSSSCWMANLYQEHDKVDIQCSLHSQFFLQELKTHLRAFKWPFNQSHRIVHKLMHDYKGKMDVGMF